MVTGFYKDAGNSDRFQNITKGMFWSKDEPTFDEKGHGKGKKVRFSFLKGKGAEIKALMPALKWAWGMSMNNGDDQHKEVMVALQCSVFLDEVLDAHRDVDVLDPGEATKFKHAGFAMMSCFTSLSAFYAAKGTALFNITPKCHCLLHICMSTKWLNPRRSWCFSGEDFMRHVRRMGSIACKGSNAAQAGNKIVSWYSHALGFTLA